MQKVSNLDLLEPTKLYNDRLKDAFHDNADEFFETLNKQANVDVEANRLTVKKYKKYLDEETKLGKKAKSTKVFKGFLIAFAIIFGIAGVVCLVMGILKKVPNVGLMIGIGAGAIFLSICLLFLIILKVSKDIKQLNQRIDEVIKKKEAAMAEGYTQMAPLNSLFDWGMPAKLLNETIPLFQMDEIFDPSKFEYLKAKFGFDEDHSDCNSSLFVQSGSILGNPFLIMENYCQNMIDHVYTGTRTVTYSKKVYVDGSWKTTNVSQVLVGKYTAPEPNYYVSTTLLYGNEAAPNLNFSRHPSPANSMNENKIDDYVKKQDKSLDKYAQKNIDKGFVRLQNPEFEALFGALDRDNNVEFRLLFTPLAQKNIVNLIRNKQPYGDDFSFRKNKCLNYIASAHSQVEGLYRGDPNKFINFSFDDSKKSFVDYCDTYLKSLYFDFAPLMSIPLYQQTKTSEYIHKGLYKENITSFEVESSANRHNRDKFRPDNTITNIILKSEFVNKVNEGDLVNIHSYSFTGTDRIAYVKVMAGDGKFYDVPVHWIDYQKADKITPFVVQNVNCSMNKYNNISNTISSENDILFNKRFVSYVPNGTDSALDSFIKSLNATK